MDKKLRLSLQSLAIDIISDNAPFLSYVKKQFFYHASDAPTEAGTANIELRMAWTKDDLKKNMMADGKHWQRIASNTYVGEKECVYMDKINGRRSRVHVGIDGQRLRVSVLQERAGRAWPFKRSDDEQMRRACYHFIYCPMFFYLQHFHNTHPLHAGAFVLKGKTFVLVGLDKMGKTTLSLHSVNVPGSSFIADNIILHDEKVITPCYTPLKIRSDDGQSLPATFRQITKEKEKTFYAPPASGERAYDPDFVIIPSFCEKDFVKEVSSSEACAVIMNTNILASEMKDYFNAAALWNLMVAAGPLLVSQQTALTALLKRSRCFQVGIARSEAPRETLQRLSGLIT